MWQALVFSGLWMVGAPPMLQSHSISGRVWDAMPAEHQGAIVPWLALSREDRSRFLVPLAVASSARTVEASSSAPPGQIKVPPSVIFADGCSLPSGARFIYLEPQGLIDDHGQRWLKKDALFPFGDPAVLYRASLCHVRANGKPELRFLARDGIWIVPVESGQEPYLLAYTHQIRLYSSRVRKGFRPMRPYDTAVSLYGPHYWNVDINGDKREDFAVAHDDRIVVYRRGSNDLLDQDPLVTLHLASALAFSPDADYRVHFGNLDGIGGAELIVGVSEGSIPRESVAYLFPLSGDAVFSKPQKLWTHSGWSAPLRLLERPGGNLLVQSKVNTNLMSMAGSLVSGHFKIEIWLRKKENIGRRVYSSQLDVDVKGGKRAGVLPIMGIDFDGDGLSDLVDLGKIGKARWIRGSAEGFHKTPAASYSISPFQEVVPLSAAKMVVMWGEPQKDGKSLRTAVQVLKPK